MITVRVMIGGRVIYLRTDIAADAIRVAHLLASQVDDVQVWNGADVLLAPITLRETMQTM